MLRHRSVLACAVLFLAASCIVGVVDGVDGTAKPSGEPEEVLPEANTETNTELDSADGVDSLVDGDESLPPSSPEAAKAIMDEAANEFDGADSPNQPELAGLRSPMGDGTEATEMAVSDLGKSIELCGICAGELKAGTPSAPTARKGAPAPHREADAQIALNEGSGADGSSTEADRTGRETESTVSEEHGPGGELDRRIKEETKKWAECFARHNFAGKSPKDCREFTDQFLPREESVSEESSRPPAPRPAESLRPREDDSEPNGEEAKRKNDASARTIGESTEATEKAVLDLEKSIELCGICAGELKAGTPSAPTARKGAPAPHREADAQIALNEGSGADGSSTEADRTGRETESTVSEEHGPGGELDRRIKEETKKWAECFARHNFAGKSPKDCKEFTDQFLPREESVSEESSRPPAPRPAESLRPREDDTTVLPPVDSEPSGEEAKLKEFCELKKSVGWQESTEKTCLETKSGVADGGSVYAHAKSCFIGKHLSAVDPTGQCRDGFSLESSLFKQHCNCENGEDRVKVSITRGPEEEVAVDGQEVDTFARLIPCKAIGDRKLVCFKATAVEDTCKREVFASAEGEALVPCACYSVDAEGHGAKLVSQHEEELFDAARQTLLGAGCSAQAILGSKDCQSSEYPAC